MPSFSTSELGAFAFLVLETVGPNAWLVLVTGGSFETTATRLSAEMAALAEVATIVSVSSGLDLERATQEHTDGVVIVVGAHQFADPDWHRVDLNRTRFERTGTTVLVLDPSSVERLENTAPNFASWIGGSIWRLEPARPLDGVAAEQRLVALRAWAALPDREIIRLAEAGELPADPEYAEWLTLLGRGDLLAR